MNKGLAAVAIAVVALTGLGLLGHYLVTAQDFRLIREQLEARAEALTGMRLQLNGPLTVPYSLIPEVELHDVVLSNPAFTDHPEIFSVATLKGDVDLLGLLRGELSLTHVEATGARLYLEIGSDGAANWMDPDDSPAREGELWLSLRRLQLEDVVVSHVNRLTGRTFEVPIDRFVAEAEANSDPIEFELSTTLNGRWLEVAGTMASLNDLLYGDAFPVDLAIEIEGLDMQVTGTVDRYEDGEFSGVNVIVSAEGSNLAELEDFIGVALPRTDEFAVNGRLFSRPSGPALRDLRGEMMWRDHEVRFDAEIGGLAPLAGVTARFEFSGDDIREIGRLVGRDFPHTESYRGSATISGSLEALSLSELSLEVVDGNLHARIEGAVDSLDPLEGIDVRVAVDGEDLGELGNRLSVALPASDQFQVSGRIQGSANALSVVDLEAELRRGEDLLGLRGRLDELLQLQGIDIQFHAEAGNLAELLAPWGLGLPDTDSVIASGTLSGSAERLTLTGLQANLRRGTHQLAVQGTVLDVLAPDVFSLTVDAIGQDIAELGSLFDVALPHSDAYSVSATVDRDGEVLSLADLNAMATRGRTTLNTRGRIDSATDLQGLDLTFTLSAVGAAALVSDLVGLPLELGSDIKLEGRVRGSVPRLDLQELRFDADDSHLAGNANVDWGDGTRISMSLNGGLVDLTPHNDWIFSLAGERPQGKLFSARAIDLEFLRAWDVELQLENVELIPVQDHSFIIEHLALRLQDGVLTVDPLRVRGADAELYGSLTLDSGATPPKLAVSAELDRGELEFLLAYWGIEDSRGQVDLRFELDGELESMHGFAQTAEGTVLVLVRDLGLPRTGLNLRTTEILLSAFPWSDQQKDLSIDCGMARFTIADGLLTPEFFFADGPEMIFRAVGTIDLASETYDLVASPRGKRQRWRNHNINVRVSGSLDDPKITTHSGSVVRFAVESLGKYSLLGPLGILVPLRRARPDHPCVTSVEELVGITD